MIKGIYFSNYKAFRTGHVEIRPITLIIGKNSSGKSSICKLLPLLSKSLSNRLPVPFLLDNDGVSVGARYNDVFRGQTNSGLVLGVETLGGLQIDSEFIINNGELVVYSNKVHIGTSYFISWFDDASKNRIKGMFSESFLRDAKIQRRMIQMSVDYISPLRREANYAIRYKGKGYCCKVGDDGSNAYDLLIDSYLDGSPLYKKVSLWMENNLEGQRLIIKRLAGDSEVFGFYVNRGGVLVNLADVGQGISQLLPIIVQSFLPSEYKADVTVIEQPALHLHPAAHAAVAERLVRAAVGTKKRYVIESHSENMLLCIRKLVHEKVLRTNDIIVYYVHNDDGNASLQEISINENGLLSSWPEGVFSEGFDLMSSIYS